MSEALRNSAGSIGTVSNVTAYAAEIDGLIEGKAPVGIVSNDPTIEDPSVFALEKHLEDFLEHNWKHTELGQKYDIYEVDAEVFAPCAMGGILNDGTIPRLKAHIVAGAANNQLLKAHNDIQLLDRKILYVPDYVINAGGVICVGYEYFRKSGHNPLDFDISRESMVVHVERIGNTVADVLNYAKEHQLGTGEAADKLAEEKFMGGQPLNVAPPANSGPNGGKTLVQ